MELELPPSVVVLTVSVSVTLAVSVPLDSVLLLSEPVELRMIELPAVERLPFVVVVRLVIGWKSCVVVRCDV